jgi:hypothetical protein
MPRRVKKHEHRIANEPPDMFFQYSDGLLKDASDYFSKAYGRPVSFDEANLFLNRLATFYKLLLEGASRRNRDFPCGDSLR